MRILFVAPSSYPIFGSEANVNAKVLKMLTDEGCIVDLVCRFFQGHHYPASINSFFFKNVNSITSVRVRTTRDIKTIIRHLRTFIKTGYIYKGVDWAFAAIKECERLISKNEYNFIYTYDNPSEVVGLYLTQKYKIKWVATWNDPYMWIKYPYPYGKGLNAKVGYFRNRIISDIGKYVYCNVFPSPRLRDYMYKYMVGMKEKKSFISPHIIIEELLLNSNSERVNSSLKILHAGALGRERNPDILLKGLKAFLVKNPGAQIELTFLGVLERLGSTYLSDLVKEYDLSEYIKILPPVSYLESLSIIREYDICLLLEAPCDEGIFLPGKISDYMQNNRIIWCISPINGLMHDLYLDGHIGYFSDVKDVESVERTLLSIYDDFKHRLFDKNKSFCRDYLSKNVYMQHKSILCAE